VLLEPSSPLIECLAIVTVETNGTNWVPLGSTMKKKVQRKLIIDSAFAKFRRLGIRRVTLDEIARELRISKKTLYVHFATKEDLVRACTEQLRERLLPAITAAVSAQATVVERVAAIAGVLAEIPRSVSRDFVADLKADYPHIWTEIDAQRRAVFAGMESLFEEGVERGEMWPEIHPRVVVRVLLAILDNVFVPEVMLQGEFTPAEALATVTTLLVRGSLVEPPPHQPASES
jgi:AcrR family transcriptional regulator